MSEIERPCAAALEVRTESAILCMFPPDHRGPHLWRLDRGHGEAMLILWGERADIDDLETVLS